MTRKPDLVTWEGWFALDVPRGWHWEETDGIISVYNPEGAGALHFSCLYREGCDEPDLDEVKDMAQRFTDEQGWDVPAEDIHVRTLDGTPVVEMELVTPSPEPEYWQVWHLIDRTRAILATYVCDAGDEEEERTVREKLMSSFRWDRSHVQ
ncbi:MAG: hypothetical protein AB2A00_14065 [Myxococcota bacterium]